MAPKVLSGTTLGPQMAIKIHHWVPQNSPRALPSWPPSHTLAIISNFHSFLVPPSLELGSLGDARDRFWKPPKVNLRAYCHFIQLVALPCKLRASNLRGSAGGRSPSNPPPPSRRAGFQGVSNLHSDFCRLLTSDGPRPIRRPDPFRPATRPKSAPQAPNVI